MSNIIDKIQLSGVTYDIGGSGGGVTSGEVQTMIDESISGKADSSDVYTTGQTSGATEIANALSAKLDADFDNSLGFDINDDLGVYAEGNSEDIVFNTASSKVKEYTFPSVYTNGSNNNYKVGFNSSVSLELNQSFSGTVSTTKAIGVKYLDTNDELKECWWDYSNNVFTINSDYSANNSVRLTYNSYNHKITLSRQNTSLKTIITIMVGGDYYIASSSNPTEADCYISYIKIYTSIKKLQSVLNEKQRQLTAGDGIKLDNYGNISANIKVTGDTREKVFNKATSATSINSLEETSISFNVNTGYTGDTTSTWFNLSVTNLNVRDEYGQAYIKYDAQNDSFSIQGGGDNITMSYSAHVLTVTAHKITAIDSNNGFAALNDFDNVGCLFGKVYTNSNVYTIQDAIDNKVDTSDVTTAVTSGSTDAEIPTAKAVYDQMGGLKLVKLTQSEYDALDPNYDSNTLYVING